MSEFSDNLALAWSTSTRVFGDTITIDGDDYDCVIHGFEGSDEVQRGRPGRVQTGSGTVVMALADWTTAGGAKGTRVTFSFGTFRVSNDPNVGSDSAEVVLQCAPLT